jgi:outer membrane protein OmpA-like peptidoglycan-associated protein
MKGVDLKRVFIVVIMAYLSFLLGCTGMVAAPKHGIWFYHKELPKADKAVEAARSAGKDKECPEAFKAVEDLKNKAYETYWACRTEEAIAMANEATKKANALCPLPYPLPAPESKVIDRMTLIVHFDTDKSEIKKGDKAELQRAINFIRKYPGAKVRIEGHTDSIGSEQHNQRLSERRAEAVKNYLVKAGVCEETKTMAIGYGESRPVAPNTTEEGRAKNRRVEILILSD